MRLRRQLARWIDAELITERQAERIATFEQGRGRPLFVRSIATLGGFAIAVGLVSIVAANWAAIDGRLKIGVALALLGGLGWAIVRGRGRWPDWAVESALVVDYGLVLASIALVGQVYQLGGRAHAALLAWSVLTGPLMALARSGFAAVLWLAGLQTTFFAVAVHHASMETVVGLAVVPSLLALAVARSERIRALRPALARAWEAVAWAELVIAGSLGTGAFYAAADRDDLRDLWPGLALTVGLATWLWTRIPSGPAQLPTRGLLVTAVGLAYGPLLLALGPSEWAAAASLIGLWLLVGLVGHRTGRAALVNLATAVIGVRILVVYFEVFGSLLGTGAGLVVGGLLTLGLVWLWLRRRPDRRVTDGEEGR